MKKFVLLFATALSCLGQSTISYVPLATSNTPSTTYTRGFLLQTNAEDARSYLGLSGTNGALSTTNMTVYGTLSVDGSTGVIIDGDTGLITAGGVSVVTNYTVYANSLVWSDWVVQWVSDYATNAKSGNTLYVSPTGNDSTAAIGRSDLPWASVTAALSNVVNDSVVKILPGTYEIASEFKGNPATNYVSANLVNKTNVTIDASGVTITSLTGWGTMMMIANCQDIVFIGGNWVGSRLMSTNYVVGSGFHGAVACGTNNGVAFVGCKWIDWPDQVITAMTYATKRTDRLTVRNNTFQNCGCTNATWFGVTYDGACISGLIANNALIADNTMIDCVRGVEYEDGGVTNAVSCTNIVISGNILQRPIDWGILVDGATSNQWAYGVIVSGNSISYSTNYTSGIAGIWLGRVKESKVSGNVVRNFRSTVDGRGSIILTGCEKVDVDGNLIEDCNKLGIGVTALSSAPFSGSSDKIRIFNNTVRGIWLIGINGSALNCWIENNLCADFLQTYAVGIMASAASEVSSYNGATTNVVIRNNRMVGSAPGNNEFIYFRNGATIARVVVDGNKNESSARSLLDSSGSTIDYGTIQTSNLNVSNAITAATVTTTGVITGNGSGLTNLQFSSMQEFSDITNTGSLYNSGAIHAYGGLYVSGGNLTATNSQLGTVVASGTFTGNGSGLTNMLVDGLLWGADGLLNNRRWGTVRVVSSGTISNTIANVTNASAKNRVLVYVPNGTYTEWFSLKPWVDVVGQSRTGVIIQSAVTNDDTVKIGGFNSMLANCTVIHTTALGNVQKYPIHCDAGLDTTLQIAEPIVYNVTALANGGNGKSGIGVGLQARQKVYLVNSLFCSDATAGIYIHNTASQSDACQAYVLNCIGISTNQWGLNVQGLGSGWSDTVDIVGGSFTGGLAGIYRNGADDWIVCCSTNGFGATTFNSLILTNTSAVLPAIPPASLDQTSPAQLLQVMGNGVIGSTVVGSNLFSGSQPSFDGFLMIGGKLGVGATNWATGARDMAKIYSVSSGTNVGIFIHNGAATAVNNSTEVNFGNWSGESALSPAARIQSREVTSATGASDFRIFTKGDGATFAERLRIHNSGNIGIGTTNPATLLDVAGTVTSSNVVTSGYSTILTNATPPTVPNNGGVLWNSNMTLYWVTPTTTNKLAP